MSWLSPSEYESELALKYRPSAAADPDEQDFYRLLRVLALALRIEPLLLRNARMHFASGSDTEWETEIWFSPLIRTRTVKAAVMREGVARKLLDDLVNEPKEYETARVFVDQQTHHWSEADRLEQRLRLAAASQDQNALKDGFQQMLRTLGQSADDHERREWARLIKGALPELVKESGSIPEVGWLQQYVAAALGSAGEALRRESRLEPMPGWLLQSLPKSSGHSLYVRLRPGILECLKEAHDQPFHEIKLRLPLPTPLLLSEDDRPARWEGFWPGRIIRIARDMQSLTLQTLTGERFQFTVQRDQEQSDPFTGPGEKIVLAFLPQDRNAARQIARILAGHGIEITLVEDDPDKPPVFSGPEADESIRLMRLWTRNAAEYWRERFAEADRGRQGLLLRTEPNLRAPEGIAEARVVDLGNLEKGLDQETAGRLIEAIRHISKLPEDAPKAQRDISDELDRLLNEINDPATEPPRRLQIGDRLAELGDPRHGVGVREIRLPVGPERPGKDESAVSATVRSWLDELNDLETDPPRRLQIGDELARVGDP
ncbi:MAG: hypothetical protein L0Y43_10310, partial [Methylococcaceae bacterium]|nr:hypothetical protein [Methylococcaceae bacterium]